jgi:hypothetical protein
MPFAARTAIAVILLGASLAPRTASADWPILGRALTSAPNDQDRARIAPDGAGGAIVTWQDFKAVPVSIFAQHVLASGDLDAAWPVNGLPLLTDPAGLATAKGTQEVPVIVADGTGGAIIAWVDERNDLVEPDVFAQHVLGSGVVDPAWPANGLAVNTVRGAQDHLSMVSDGAGGAIITWMDGRLSGGGFPNGVDIFAQHVLASGRLDPAWLPGGVALCTAPNTQASPKIASDGAGGAIVTWFDFRSATTGEDVFAQHVTSAGVVDPAWPVNGRALTLAAGEQTDPSIVSDDAHGALVFWTDTRSGSNQIFGQRVLGTGAIAPGWPVNGLPIATAPGDAILPLVAPDGESGAIVTWEDARGINHNPYAQHVLPSGIVDPAWPVNGRALSGSSGEEFNASIVSDGGRGAIVAWEEDSFILVQHVEASGILDPGFPVNGRFVRLDLAFQERPDLVAAGGGNAIVTWANGDSGLDHDIFANQVVTAGTASVNVGPRAGGITFAAPTPNPARGPLTLRFSLQHDANVHLAIYDASGRHVRELSAGTQLAGQHLMTWDLRDEDGRLVGHGLFFARLEAGGSAFSQKIVTLK